MKITVLHAEAGDLGRVRGLVEAYINAGYADGKRPKQRDCVIYGSTFRNAYVWGGPEHIRVAFERLEAAE